MSKYQALFQSENLDFINLSVDLINDYLVMINDEDIQKKILTKRKVYTYEDRVLWVKRKLEEQAIIFSIIERSSGNFVGNIEFMDLKSETAEIGITITPSYQNKHYGTEALKKMIEYGFNVLGLNEINLVVYSNNVRAIHCYKKLGFIETRVEKNVAIIDGQSVDDIYMKLGK